MFRLSMPRAITTKQTRLEPSRNAFFRGGGGTLRDIQINMSVCLSGSKAVNADNNFEAGETVLIKLKFLYCNFRGFPSL